MCICQKKGSRYQDNVLLPETKTPVCKVNGIESVRRWTFRINVNISYNAKAKVKHLHNSYNMYEVRDGAFCSSNNAGNQEIFLNLHWFIVLSVDEMLQSAFAEPALEWG